MTDQVAGEVAQRLEATTLARAIARREHLLARAAGRSAFRWVDLILGLPGLLALTALAVNVPDRASSAVLLALFGVLSIGAVAVVHVERRLDAVVQLLRTQDLGGRTTDVNSREDS
jgi:hypothetical protein